MNKLLLHIITAFTLLLFGCGGGKPRKPPARHKNIVVIADLGRRLALYDQAGRDRAVFDAVFGALDKSIRTQMYVHAKDKLHVIIAPNKLLNPALTDWQNRLMIDLEQVPVKDRVKYMKTCRGGFFGRIDSLYRAAAAVLPDQPSDTWLFLNNQLNSYLQADTSFDNYVIVISDGYCNGGTAVTAGEYTGSAPLMAAARLQPGWQQFVNEHPLKKIVFNTPRLHFFFAELHPDSLWQQFPDELNLLQQVWRNWAQWCSPAGSSKTLPRITLANVKNEIMAFMEAAALNTASVPPATPTAEGQKNAIVVQPPLSGQKPAAEKTAEPAAATAPSKNNPVKPVHKPGAEAGGFSIRQDF